MLEAIILLIFSLILLVWSADKLVYGAAAVAKNYNIPPAIIGMTILAMGSSAPEMVVSGSAALAGKTDTAVGNVLGSNIANIAFILGVSALVSPLAINPKMLKREIPILVFVTLLAGGVLSDYHLSIVDGVTLFAIFAIFIITMIRLSNKKKEDLSDINDEIPSGVSNKAALIWVVIGLILLPFSADTLVDSATIIAKYYGMSDLIIGLTIIAIGTSLPELAASLAGIKKGETDMAVGNIIGSNIFNILAVMGIPAFLNPSSIDAYAMSRDYLIMFVLTILLVIMALDKHRRINRWEGFVLFAIFVGYQIYLFSHLTATAVGVS